MTATACFAACRRRGGRSRRRATAACRPRGARGREPRVGSGARTGAGRRPQDPELAARLYPPLGLHEAIAQCRECRATSLAGAGGRGANRAESSVHSRDVGNVSVHHVRQRPSVRRDTPVASLAAAFVMPNLCWGRVAGATLGDVEVGGDEGVRVVRGFVARLLAHAGRAETTEAVAVPGAARILLPVLDEARGAELVDLVEDSFGRTFTFSFWSTTRTGITSANRSGGPLYSGGPL